MADFCTAFAKILSQEGGYVDDKNDHGGATKFGVSLAYLKSQNLFNGDINGNGEIDSSDIKDLTIDDTKAIYKMSFWDPNNLGQLQGQRLATMVFGLCVNLGSKRAIEILQTSFNIRSNKITLVIDGELGPVTLKSINNSFIDGPDSLVNTYKSEAIEHYENLVKLNPNLAEFLHGWINRVNQY